MALVILGSIVASAAPGDHQAAFGCYPLWVLGAAFWLTGYSESAGTRWRRVVLACGAVAFASFVWASKVAYDYAMAHIPKPAPAPSSPLNGL